MSHDRSSALAAALLLPSILSLCACGTSTPLDARAELPEHPKTNGYLALEDTPPKPERPAMTADEQLKLKKELAVARDRQAKGNAEGNDPRTESTKP